MVLKRSYFTAAFITVFTIDFWITIECVPIEFLSAGTLQIILLHFTEILGTVGKLIATVFTWEEAFIGAF